MKVSRPAAVAFGARIVALIATFGMNVVIAQTLSLAQAGTVVLLMTLVTTFATVARFGTDNLSLRLMASQPVLMRTLTRPMVTVLLVAAVAATAGFLVAAAEVLSAEGVTHAGWILAAGAASILPAALSVLAGSILRGAGSLGAGTMAELGLVPMFVSAGLLVATGLGGPDVLVALSVICGAFWVTAVWAGLAGWRVLPPLTGRVLSLRAFLKDRGRSLIHMGVTALATFFMVWIPVLALGYFGTSESVALYNASARLAAFVGLISAIQVTYLATEFAKLGAARDTGQITRVAQRATRLATAVAGAMAAVLLLLPGTVLRLFGSDYVSAAPVLIILTLGGLAQVMAGPSIAVMLTCGFERTASRLTFLACAAGAAVCPLLAPRGPVAVAGAAAVLIAMPTVIGAVQLRARGVNTFISWGKP